MVTITALFHPARHWRRRHARRLGSDSLGRSRGRNRGRELEARQIFENAIEIADLHRMLLHHGRQGSGERSEEHTSELQSPCNLVCRLLLEKKKKKNKT